MVKIEFPEGWEGVIEPIRALVAELERAAPAGGTTPDLGAVSARWGQVRNAFVATARARIADALPTPKR